MSVEPSTVPVFTEGELMLIKIGLDCYCIQLYLIYCSLLLCTLPLVVIEYVYDAIVCSPVNVVEAIQSVTELVVSDAISCNENDSDCILYESYVVISSSLFGK